MALALWKAQPDALAFGVVPAYRRFELYQARYHELMPVLSARRQLPLEDWEWFYRWSKWMGARFPWLAGEVNVHLVRR